MNADTLTDREQREIRRYLRTISAGREPDLDRVPFWLAKMHQDREAAVRERRRLEAMFAEFGACATRASDNLAAAFTAFGAAATIPPEALDRMSATLKQLKLEIDALEAANNKRRCNHD